MGINQPKKGKALVWAHDLVQQLKLSGVQARDIRKIMSKVSKKEIPLPNGKNGYLIDYYEFIDVAEEVTQKKVSDFVRDVNNFKKVVKKDKEKMKLKRKEFDKDKVVKDLRTIFYSVKQMKSYRESLYIENEYEEALKKAEEDKLELEQRKQVYSQPVFIDNCVDYEKKDKRIVIPSIEEILRITIIPEPKLDETIDYFDDDYVYDEEEIDKRFEIPHFTRKQVADEPILINEKKKIQLTPEMIRSAWDRFENRFLYYMGLEPLEELPKKKEKKKFDFKKLFRKVEKKEKELTPFENKLLDVLGLSFDEEEDDYVYEDTPLMDQQVKKEKKEKITKKSKNYRNEKQRNKDVKYQVYLLCQKLCNKNINDFSLNEKVEMIQASKKYIDTLKKGEDNLFDYEKEYALLIGNKIHDYLSFNINSSPDVYDEKIINYMNSYIVDMKDYFEIETKHKIIDFKLSKETRNKIIKNISKVASLALIVALGLGAKGMDSENKDKDVKGIKHDFIESNLEETILEDKINENVNINTNININMESVTSENLITTQVLKYDHLMVEKEEDYLSIGESVQVLAGSKVYGRLSDLTTNENAQKPYFDSVDLERTIRSIVMEHDGQVQKAYSNEEVDYYLNLEYDVIGYQVDNMYSFDEDGNYVCSEGIYNSQCLIRKLEK